MGGLHVAETATHWRHSTARPMVTVAELLGRVTAVPRGSACTPAVCEHKPGVSVDALLRREGRAIQAQGRPAHPHGLLSATPDGGSPGRRLQAAVAVSTFLAAGSVVGVALSNNTADYELGNTAQPVDAPPVGQSPPASTDRQTLVPGQQSPVLGAATSTGALAAGSGPSADWTSVAFPPTAGSSASDPSAGSTETSDTSADAAAASSDEASKADAEPRGDDDNSGSDDDGDDDTRSSGSSSRNSESTPASSSPQDREIALADDSSDKTAAATSQALIPADVAPSGATPGGATPGGATPDGAESGEESSSGGAVSIDDPDGQDTPPAASDSTEDGPDAVDESGDSTDTESRTDEAAGDSDVKSGSSSADEPDKAAETSDGGDGSAGVSAS
jgi:hypothetical protein